MKYDEAMTNTKRKHICTQRTHRAQISQHCPALSRCLTNIRYMERQPVNAKNLAGCCKAQVMLQIRMPSLQELKTRTSWRNSLLQVRLLLGITPRAPRWWSTPLKPIHPPAETARQQAGRQRKCPSYRTEGRDGRGSLSGHSPQGSMACSRPRQKLVQ